VCGGTRSGWHLAVLPSSVDTAKPEEHGTRHTFIHGVYILAIGRLPSVMNAGVLGIFP